MQNLRARVRTRESTAVALTTSASRLLGIATPVLDLRRVPQSQPDVGLFTSARRTDLLADHSIRNCHCFVNCPARIHGRLVRNIICAPPSILWPRVGLDVGPFCTKHLLQFGRYRIRLLTSYTSEYSYEDFILLPNVTHCDLNVFVLRL
jgi:hypothetical protein